MTKNLIACRLGSYGKFQERAWTHLPSLGVTNLEVGVPSDEQLPALQKKLKDHGLKASSVQGRCDIKSPDAPAAMKPQFETCAKLGARFCFLSVKAEDTPRQQVYDRLRAIGDLAAASGVTVILETHPDLITNGDIAQQTMRAVAHPNIRVNFDTANVYYYNENVTAQGELAKVIDFVAALHLKDTDGGFHSFRFPALGTGVVDFPRVFALCAQRGFTGPFTMELEGSSGVELDEAGQLQYVADSVGYLKKIGALA